MPDLTQRTVKPGQPDEIGLTQKGADVLNRATALQAQDGGSYHTALIRALREYEEQEEDRHEALSTTRIEEGIPAWRDSLTADEAWDEADRASDRFGPESPRAQDFRRLAAQKDREEALRRVSAGDVLPVYARQTCPECGRVFDLTDETDAAEWYAGHDCEV